MPGPLAGLRRAGRPGADTDDALEDRGFSADEIAALHASGGVRQGTPADVRA